MLRSLAPLLTCAVLGAACGEATDVDGGPLVPPQATFSSLYANLFTQTCSGCHNSRSYPTPTGGAGNLDFTAAPATVYASLVSPGASNDTFDVGKAAFPERVVPFDPERSLLYQKLARNTPGDHGDPMPQGRTVPFDAATLAAVRTWIENGALDD